MCTSATGMQAYNCFAAGIVTVDKIKIKSMLACSFMQLQLYCVQDNWEWNQMCLPKDAQQPSARDFACIVALDGGRLLIHGGLDAQEKRLDDAWLFDTKT